MAAIPNLGATGRLGYVTVGVILAAAGLFGVDTPWVKLVCVILGGVILVSGLIGFCPARWLLARGSKAQ